MANLRWGILSTGRIAEQFAQDMAHVPNGEIVAVTSRTLAHAHEFAHRYRVPIVHDDYAALLANPGIDAVYVATPHTLHLQNAIDAMRAGKAVLCEKPLVTNVADCQTLIQVAAATNAYLMEAMWTWFLPAIRKAQQWVAEGRIGRLVHVKADFGYPLRPYAADRREYAVALGGGCLLEMGIYPVALACLFIDADPRDVRVVSRHAPNGVEDDVGMIFDCGDAIATLGTSFRCKLPNWAYLIGEDGYIAIPDFWCARSCRLYETDTLVDRFEDGRESRGLNFETEAVGNDVLAGRVESSTIPLSASLRFQQVMARVKEGFGDHSGR